MILRDWRAVTLCASTLIAMVSCAGGEGGCPTGSGCAGVADSSALGVAYINTDSLLSGYEYAQKMGDALQGKAESARADFNQRAGAFQQDMADFQRKVQNNAFLSMERAQSEQNRLQKMDQELQELNQRLSNDLMQEQGRLSAQLHDTLSNFLKEYAPGRYRMVLNTCDMNNSVLYAAPGTDITAEVVAALNERYKKSGK